MVLKMKILSVESSAASCSVALSDNGVLIGEEFTNVKLTQRNPYADGEKYT